MLAAMQNPTASPSASFTCDLAVNTGPMHWVLELRHLVARPVGRRRHAAAEGAAARRRPVCRRCVYALDANGNALGGIRSPQVDAPVAALGGVQELAAPGQVGGFCRLFGTTVPLTPEQLAALYPNHGAFVKQWNQAADRAVKAGFLTEADAKELKAAAAKSDVGKQP